MSAKRTKAPPPTVCPCGSGRDYEACCGRAIESRVAAADAEVLMRSRYTAYTMRREDYLLATWHASTRPANLDDAADTATRWLGLRVLNHRMTGADHAVVEFVARFKVGGRAHRLHEVSRFVREDGCWFYVDGDVS
jgi:SEC-C motif-containing protein